MIDDSFRIYIEQLRDGEVESLVETYTPEFLDIHEKELSFVDPIHMTGEVYLADDMLVLHLNINTLSTMPCRICNELIKNEIQINGFYHAVPISEIKTGIYDFREVLRETILLETPQLIECHQGECPKRKTLQKYLKAENDLNKETDDKYHPFADLEFPANE